jgi:hypothetical protein
MRNLQAISRDHFTDLPGGKIERPTAASGERNTGWKD